MSEKLKPCPHCGGVAVYEHATFRDPDQNRCAIVCEVCGAYGGPAIGSNRAAVEVKARELWNTRPDIRNETIDECANVADNHQCTPLCTDHGLGSMCEDVIATEIRALKEA